MADINLTVTIPDTWKTKVLDAFTAVAGTSVTLKAVAHDFNADWHFTINKKQPEETDKQFGERVLRELGKAIINMVDLVEDTARYKTELGAVTPPSADELPDILT